MKRRRKQTCHVDPLTCDQESNALPNWQNKMMDRKRQQEHISNVLQKKPEDIAMNQAEHFRSIQEDRYIIDRTIPAIDYGKGYRVGSEFWKQQEEFGDDVTGVHMTLTQIEKGYPPPIEHIGVPGKIREEKGLFWTPKYSRPMHYPWHKSSFLEERMKALDKYMKELDPLRPEFESLEVIGTANPYRTVEPEQSQNASQMILEMERQPITEMELDVDVHDIIGKIPTRTKKTKPNPFALNQTNIHRSYFNNSNGVILPGEIMKFPFVFKSPNAGVFQEQWEFDTRPVVFGGAALLVTLRGIAFAEDKYKGERLKIESELRRKEANQMMQQILEEIVGGMQTPERPSSPIDAFITEEEIFSRNNSELYYNHETVVQMKQLYIEIDLPEKRDGRTWPLHVGDLKDEILMMDDEDERKEAFLHQLNTCVSKMSFIPQIPVHKQLFTAGYQLLVEAVDEMVFQSHVIQHIMGLPEKDFDDIADDTKFKQDSRANRRLSKTPSKYPNAKLQTEDTNLSDSKNKKPSTAEKTAPKAPDRKALPPAKEKDKGGKLSKESTKTDLKAPKQTVMPATKPAPPSRSKTAGSLGDQERTSPTSVPQISLAHEDPVIDKKYKHKIYAQTYSILADAVDKMDFVFDEIMQNDSSRTLHT